MILEALEPGLQMAAAALAAQGVSAEAVDGALDAYRREAAGDPPLKNKKGV